MIVFPHAKINLGLNVLRKRADGYHDIETIMVPIPLRDMLEAIVDPSLEKGEVQYTRSGISIPGTLESDLCWRATKLIGSGNDLPGIRLHLHKVVPLGAGLGGGSSDGVHTLKLINTLLDLKIPKSELHKMAVSLGSDCPFFLEDGPQLAEGRGDKLDPIELDLKGYWLVLVNPGVHVPTPEVYRHTKPTGRTYGEKWREAISQLATRRNLTFNSSAIRELIPNVMEEFVFRAYPEVELIRKKLTEAGAVHAAMSGSGATVFGLFRVPPPSIEWPKDHRIWIFLL